MQFGIRCPARKTKADRLFLVQQNPTGIEQYQNEISGGISEISGTNLADRGDDFWDLEYQEMAGTTGLEPAASAVTV
jgi:hypothetical protein